MATGWCPMRIACAAIVGLTSPQRRTMFKGPWVMGETYSISDPYLFTLAQWLEGDGVDPARFPKGAGCTF